MTIEEYKKLALRTLNDLGSNDKNAFHMNTGIIDEAGEIVKIFKNHVAYNKPIDLVNLKEELGDLCWFIVNRSTLFNNIDNITTFGINKAYEEDESLFFDYTNEFEKYSLYVNFLLSIISMMEGNILNINYMCTYSLTNLAFIKAICLNLGFTIEEVFELNIKKLQKRYPDKFDAEKAINRNLKEERDILENN